VKPRKRNTDTCAGDGSWREGQDPPVPPAWEPSEWLWYLRRLARMSRRYNPQQADKLRALAKEHEAWYRERGLL